MTSARRRSGTLAASVPSAPVAPGDGLPAQEAAQQEAADVLAALGSSPQGLSQAEATARLRRLGPNAVRSHQARALTVLARQFKSALLILLLITATISFFVGERADAAIIGIILAASVGMGFANEYRAERAAQALHTQVRHRVPVRRDGQAGEVDVVDLVPGDVVRLALGQVVPADVRLLEASDLACEEGVLTGESLPVDKDIAPVPAGTPLAELASCALMGTIVAAGRGTGVVVATGARAEFGRIAVGLGERQPETDFQVGLRRFSMLLLQVAVTLAVLIFVMNVLLHRSVLDSVLFSLAIAVGITPQLLPAVVSTSLATGSRQLARRKVLVKRLVCIEDLGDIDVLVTDKTGTLTDGRIEFTAALDARGAPSDAVRRQGLLATEIGVSDRGVGGNPLDAALWQTPGAEQAVSGYRTLGVLPFDHQRRRVSVVVEGPSGRELITKGAPESVLACCSDVPDELPALLDAQFAAGSRVVLVASRPVPGLTAPSVTDERDLTADGILVFLDPPKASAAQSLRRLAVLGIAVKIATGDNGLVAQKVRGDLGLPAGMALTGPDIDALDDDALADAAQAAQTFARVSPEQKARVIRVLRRHGRAVGFLGDGVNDALALHAADVGISVDSATDVAKDAADVVLLEKDLGVLADGVSTGRRIFANTIKYVLMGTSSNFGNMFSAAAASAVLKFLPMLPSQILLNNLLYDSSQLTIPTDHVDPEDLHAPSHWDIGHIRRFMFFFGPISSVFDFLTFGIMLGGFHAGPELFRTGWFVESLATQTLVIFAIRTRRVPFIRSRPSWPLAVAAVAVAAIGAILPFTPLADPLGFAALPLPFFLALGGMVVTYLVLIDQAKRIFYADQPMRPTVRRLTHRHRVQRRASRFTVAHPAR